MEAAREPPPFPIFRRKGIGASPDMSRPRRLQLSPFPLPEGSDRAVMNRMGMSGACSYGPPFFPRVGRGEIRRRERNPRYEEPPGRLCFSPRSPVRSRIGRMGEQLVSGGIFWSEYSGIKVYSI